MPSDSQCGDKRGIFLLLNSYCLTGPRGLLGVEMTSDIESVFECSPDQGSPRMMEVTSVEELTEVIWDTLRGDSSGMSTDSSFTDFEDNGSRTPCSQASVDDAMPYNRGDNKKRQHLAQSFVDKYMADFTCPLPSTNDAGLDAPKSAVVVVTGATGSLGSHVIARLAVSPSVGTVVCLNRPGKQDSALSRQQDALSSKGIQISAEALAKLHVLEATTSD